MNERIKRRRKRRRQRLIDAARTVIAEKGVAVLTIADVTETADVAVGSFYTYFADKEELLEAAIWEDLQALGDTAAPELQTLTPLQRAQVMLDEAYRFVERHRDLMRAVFGEGHTAVHYQRGIKLLETRVRFGLEQQTQIPQEDVPWLTVLLSGLIAGGIRFSLDHPNVPADVMTARTMSLIQPLSHLYQPNLAQSQ